MHPFPHRYRARAAGAPTGTVAVDGEGLPRLDTHAPPEFDGPPGYWSPEALLLAAVANCYILSFRAVARASKLEWESLDAEVEGDLDRADGVLRFVALRIRARLRPSASAGVELAQAVLEKAKKTCLVTNSLAAPCELQTQILEHQQAAL